METKRRHTSDLLFGLGLFCLFVITSLLCGLAQSMGMLVLSRAITTCAPRWCTLPKRCANVKAESCGWMRWPGRTHWC